MVKVFGILNIIQICIIKRCVKKGLQGFILVFSGAEIWPHSQMNLSNFSPILKKNLKS